MKIIKNVLHSIFLIIVFVPILLFCGLATCIRYDAFCSVKDWGQMWSEAIRAVWKE